MIRKPHSLNDRRSPVSYQPRVPAKSTECQTFLKAASLKRLRLLRMMVDGGIDVNVRDIQKGYTALINVILSDVECSSQTSSMESVLEYLLRKGADPNLADYNGKTALIHACQRNKVDSDVIRMLMMYHADPHIKDLTGKQAACYVQKDKSALALLAPAGFQQSSKPKTLVRQDTLPFDFRDMYNYLTVPDNANLNNSSFLDIPDNRETKWSPKLNRRKPFYRVEELQVEYKDTEESDEMIIQCPEPSKTNSVANSTPPKVQISNENGETRLLIGLPSKNHEVHRMRNSLFEWERQMSVDDLFGQNKTKISVLRKQKTEGGVSGVCFEGFEDETKKPSDGEESFNVFEQDTDNMDVEVKQQCDSKETGSMSEASKVVDNPTSKQESRKNMHKLRRWTVDAFCET